jgi:hypothetical protein
MDLWYRPATDALGFKYHLYILVYVGDLLIIDKVPKKFMSMIQQESFTVKQSSIEEPKSYLSADVNKAYYSMAPMLGQWGQKHM